MRGIRTLGRVFSALLTALLALLLLFNLTALALKWISGNPHPGVLGFYSAVVVSGSMEPEISVNDMLVIRRQKDYAAGDVITYESGGSLVTHRIIAETENGFLTQGDANNTPDLAAVKEQQILGKVIAAIPGIGLLTEYFRTPLGMLCLLLTGVLLAAAPGWLEGSRAKHESRRKQE